MRALRVGLIGGTLALAGGAAPATAQVPVLPRALGTGNAYTALARGHESLFLNPANLGLPGTPHWSVALPQIAVGGTVLGLGLDDINELRDYDEISPERAREILDAIPGGTGVEYETKIPLAAFSFSSVAFGFSYNTIGNHSLDRDIVDLFLNGYKLGRTYAAPNTNGSRTTYLDFAVAYGRQVGPVSLGVTGHYYQGRDLGRFGIVDVDTLGSLVPPVAPDVEVTYAGVRSDGGRGFGVDVGAAMQPLPNLTVSASVANAFQSFEWDNEFVGRRLTLNSSGIRNSDFRQLRARYGQSDEDYATFVAGLQADQRAGVESLAAGLLEEAELPTTLRVGAAWTPRTGTDVAADFRSDLTDSRIGGLWDRSVSVGVQQKLPVITLRAGLSTNLDEGSLMTAGLSLGPIQFGVGRLDNGSGAGGADREGWVATFGLSTRSGTVVR